MLNNSGSASNRKLYSSNGGVSGASSNSVH